MKGGHERKAKPPDTRRSLTLGLSYYGTLLTARYVEMMYLHQNVQGIYITKHGVVDAHHRMKDSTAGLSINSIALTHQHGSPCDRGGRCYTLLGDAGIRINNRRIVWRTEGLVAIESRLY